MPILGLRYLENMEIIQTNYYKKLLSLPLGAPNAALRLELDLTKLSYKVLSGALNWIEVLLASDPNRLAKIVLLRQVVLHENKSQNNIQEKYNWFSQVDQILQSVRIIDASSRLDPGLWPSLKIEALRKYQEQLKFTDLLNYYQSTSMSFLSIKTHHDKPARTDSVQTSISVNFLLNFVCLQPTQHLFA